MQERIKIGQLNQRTNKHANLLWMMIKKNRRINGNVVSNNPTNNNVKEEEVDDEKKNDVKSMNT